LLDYNKTYYWKIVARDKYGSIREGDLWKFTIDIFNCGITTVVLDSSIYGTVDFADHCWLDRNLGASRVAISADDSLSYGGLYQWGRLTDGHEYPYSSTTYNLASSPVPGHDQFIVFHPDPYFHWDWMAYPDASRWQGLDGINNPCPADWQVPDASIMMEAIGYLPNPYNAFESPLKISYGGGRNGVEWMGAVGGDFISRGTVGLFWSSTENTAFRFSPDGSYEDWDDNWGANGYAVRCVKNLIRPSEPSDPSPAQGAINIIVFDSLSWFCTHPENDDLLYNIYFGDTIDPPLIATNYSLNTWVLETLNFNTTYYWKVVAIDEAGYPTVGPVWNFTTIEFTCGNSIIEHEGLFYQTVQADDRCWLDRNLGAVNVGQFFNDPTAFGDYYQWGRLKDGHQNPGSNITLFLSNNNVPGNSNFIVSPSFPFDWRNPQNDLLWQGENGINNPCPGGWRLPSDYTWQSVSSSWTSQIDAFNSPLKLVSSGLRSGLNGNIIDDNTGEYWSQSVDGTNSNYLSFDVSSVSTQPIGRGYGFPVRCIKAKPIVAPTNPFPSDNSQIHTKYLDLKWSPAIDPDGEPIFYDIYFAQGTDLQLIESGVTDTVYDLQVLEYNKIYYWKIIARDEFGSFAESDMWSFTIGLFSCGVTTVELNYRGYGTVD